ncbi:MAG TPA: hypothetical protein VK658_26060 [Chryseolinea sp.]|nr:hypothetical protein [Chryseolinea sp.]
MKKHLVLIAFMMAGVVVLAQERGRGHRDEDVTARRDNRDAHNHRVASDRYAKIKRELSLSDRQFDRFQEANKSYREKLSHMKHASLNEHSRKAEFMKLRKGHERDLRSILNKKQYQQWNDRKKSHHHQRGDRHHRHHGVSRGR